MVRTPHVATHLVTELPESRSFSAAEKRLEPLGEALESGHHLVGVTGLVPRLGRLLGHKACTSAIRQADEITLTVGAHGNNVENSAVTARVHDDALLLVRDKNLKVAKL